MLGSELCRPHRSLQPPGSPRRRTVPRGSEDAAPRARTAGHGQERETDPSGSGTHSAVRRPRNPVPERDPARPNLALRLPFVSHDLNVRNSSKLPGPSPRAPSPALSRGHRPRSRLSLARGRSKPRTPAGRWTPLQERARLPAPPAPDTSLGGRALPQPVESQLPLRKRLSRPTTDPLACSSCSSSGSQHRPGSQLLEHQCSAPVFTFRLPFAHRKRKPPCPTSDLPTFEI